MPRAATIAQADISRAARVLKNLGYEFVEVIVNCDGSFVVRPAAAPQVGTEKPIASSGGFEL